MKQFIFLFFFAFITVQSQEYTVTGVFMDSLHKVENIALYKIENGEPRYLKFTKVKKDTFRISMKTLTKGYYRALYKNVKTGYVDFIYNKENVLFEVDSRVGQSSVGFLASRENQLLGAYQYNMNTLQRKLDSIQFSFFNHPNGDVVLYKEVKSKVDGAQKYYEDLAQNDYCLGEIKASKRYNAPLPFTLPGEYLESLVHHYFDFVDFKDERLRNASFLKNKISEYVFYLHQSQDVGQQNKLLLNAMNTVLSLTEDASLKEEILRFLMQTVVEKENYEVLVKTMEIYKGLPKEIQKQMFINETNRFAKVMLGVIAPNITISGQETLYDLNATDQYLVIFWSSTCSHCLQELPQVKKILTTKSNITVVAVGIEDKEDQKKWQEMSRKFPNWKHTIAIGKWESKAADDYNVSATPSYFLLNKDKRIISKPQSLGALKQLMK
ncbi:TlpA disulfide reductase family protein [Wenyingzhuangia sp. 1_MG-2023]|nr:TlpA disulfide reductase family protein [Wenyingzhuangia sp. 1_MG-2023]